MSVRTKVNLPVNSGVTTQMVTFDILGAHDDNFALLFPGWDKEAVPEVRIHSECVTGDTLGSLLCDCGPQLRSAFNRFSASGGILIYLRQEGRGIGLKAKIDAYELQQTLHVDTNQANLMLGHKADERDYLVAAEMLQDLGVTSIRLITNNPDKVKQLEDYGIRVVDRAATGTFRNPHNMAYLSAKQEQGHDLK